MAELHAAPAVVHRSAGARAEEVDEELLFPRHTVRAAVRPEPAELRVALQARQEIVRHRRDRIVSAEALVEALLSVAHDILLVCARSARRGPFYGKPPSRSCHGQTFSTTSRSFSVHGSAARRSVTSEASVARMTSRTSGVPSSGPPSTTKPSATSPF